MAKGSGGNATLTNGTKFTPEAGETYTVSVVVKTLLAVESATITALADNDAFPEALSGFTITTDPAGHSDALKLKAGSMTWQKKSGTDFVTNNDAKATSGATYKAAFKVELADTKGEYAFADGKTELDVTTAAKDVS